MDEDFLYEDDESVDDYDFAEEFDEFEGEEYAMEDYYEPEDSYEYESEEYAAEDYYEPESAEARRPRRSTRVTSRRGGRGGRSMAARRRAAILARRRAEARRLQMRPRIARPKPRSPYVPPGARRPASSPRVSQGFKRVGSDVKRNRAAIKTVDLSNRVQTDRVGRALSVQNGRIKGNEYALASTKIVDELKERFPDLLKNNEVLKTALPLAPLLFLKPSKSRPGIEGIISDPRVWGPLLTVGAALFSQSRGGQNAEELSVTPAAFTLNATDTVPLRAAAKDRNGRILSEQPNLTWESSNNAVATVDEKGLVKGVSAGTVLITATVENTSVLESVTITVPADA